MECLFRMNFTANMECHRTMSVLKLDLEFSIENGPEFQWNWIVENSLPKLLTRQQLRRNASSTVAIMGNLEQLWMNLLQNLLNSSTRGSMKILTIQWTFLVLSSFRRFLGTLAAFLPIVVALSKKSYSSLKTQHSP